MVNLVIDGQHLEAEEGWTVLEAARYYGINTIPTLCYKEGLSTDSSCRLCVVEVISGGRSRLSASCSYPVQEGIEVRTNSQKVRQARKIIIELLLASCPNSKTLQCLASQYGVKELRFRVEDRGCILCGLCVRMCQEQMRAGAIGFINRGTEREVSMPFHKRYEICRECGACLYICPVCELQCRGRREPGDLCNGCFDALRLEPFPSGE